MVTTRNYLQNVQLSTVLGLFACLLLILFISSCTYSPAICTDPRWPIEIALSHHRTVLSEHDWVSVNDEAQRIQMWKTLNCPTRGYFTLAH